MGRGLLENFEAKEMLAYQHSGFSVDASVCIEAHDRAALERLLRYCAQPRPHRRNRLKCLSVCPNGCKPLTRAPM